MHKVFACLLYIMHKLQNSPLVTVRAAWRNPQTCGKSKQEYDEIRIELVLSRLILSDGCKCTLFLRNKHSVVALVTLVNNVYLTGIGVLEHEEGVVEKVHLENSLVH